MLANSAERDFRVIRVFRYSVDQQQGELVTEKKLPQVLDLELTIRGHIVLARLVRMYKITAINWRKNVAVFLNVVDPEVHLFVSLTLFSTVPEFYCRSTTSTEEYVPPRFQKTAAI